MFKEHSTHMTRAEIVNALISGSRNATPKPKMVDNFLDLPAKERQQAQFTLESAYHSLPIDGASIDVPRNPLILPDRLVNSFLPVFTIRHPAKQVGSYYRASRIFGTPVDHPETEIANSYAFTRRLFDYYRALFKGNADVSDWPVVIDDDDLINDTERIGSKFCEIMDLDPSGVIYRWEKHIEPNPMVAVFKGTLNASKGVVKNPVRLIRGVWLV